ncbi:hypothetical protein CDAR_413742 [Caerostris darwini]|uniref:Uncharacterized protein n=1 Tax=Caerostris darwini TaxID=1538125 RepID=A0AAV4UE05_9ARAC|nr:hypothetical protein CDAR_413742 [Caerostris darwini]
MAGQHMEVGLRGNVPFHCGLFHPHDVVQIFIFGIAEKDIRKNCVPMFHFYGFNTSQFCVGFLCLFHRHQMVESIHSHSLARQIDEQYFFVRRRDRRDGSSTKADPHEVPEPGPNSCPQVHQHGCQEKISDQRTRCRSRFHDKIRIGDVKLSPINGI